MIDRSKLQDENMYHVCIWDLDKPEIHMRYLPYLNGETITKSDCDTLIDDLQSLGFIEVDEWQNIGFTKARLVSPPNIRCFEHEQRRFSRSVSRAFQPFEES